MDYTNTNIQIYKCLKAYIKIEKIIKFGDIEIQK